MVDVLVVVELQRNFTKKRIKMDEREELTPIKGLLVFKIDIGHMSPSKAEDCIVRMKECFLAELELEGKKIPDDVVIWWLPIRPGSETSIEYQSFDGSNTNPEEFSMSIPNEDLDLDYDEELSDA